MKYKSYMPLESISRQYEVYDRSAIERAIENIKGVGVYWGPCRELIGKVTGGKIVGDNVIFEYESNHKIFEMLNQKRDPIIEIGFP